MRATGSGKLGLALLGGLVLLCLPGCSAEWWTGKTTMETRIDGPGWSFRDTKDNDISIKDVTYDPTTKSGHVGEVIVHNNASTPIAAEVARIQAIGEAQMSQVAYLTGVMNGLIGMIGAAGNAAPGFNFLRPPASGSSFSLPTPLGTISAGQTPADAAAYQAYTEAFNRQMLAAQEAAKAVALKAAADAAAAATATPTSQPSVPPAPGPAPPPAGPPSPT